MRRFASLLFFLALVNDGVALFSQYMFAPFAWVRPVLFESIGPARPFEYAMIVVLLFGRMRGRPATPDVRPMRRFLYVAAGVILFELTYGLATGGDGHAAGWQMYLPLSMILATFAFASVCRTAEHFATLWNLAVAAGVYHAVMAIIFYVRFVRDGHMWPVPEYLSTHEDTVVWTTSICFVLTRAIQFPTRRNRTVAAVIVPLFLVAIQLNNRRLAWISLAGSVLALYFLLPPSPVRRKIHRWVAIAVPVLLLYVAIGWGHSNQAIFAPLRAFETVSTAEDASTKARNVENLGLIATAQQANSVFGTGLGHKYTEVSEKYQIHGFELWPYVPHNSVLGLLTYTGFVGFIGYWMVFPAGVFFHARLARAPNPAHRLIGFTAIAQIVACADQWYGDMGSFSIVTAYSLAISLAAALRLPTIAGVWPPAAPAVRGASGARGERAAGAA
ncbi:MAG TPA: O-antigen ligase family protein [Polyangiaceae bacterium]